MAEHGSKAEIHKYDELYSNRPDYGQVDPTEPRFAVALEYLRRLDDVHTVLEAGIGRGGFYRLIRDEYDAWGIEPSAVAVEKYHSQDPHVKNVFIQELPDHFEPGSFDVVVSLDVLEHIPEADVDGALDALATVGKRDFIFSVAHHVDVVDGHDLHVCDHAYEWWEERFARLFVVTEFTSIHLDRARVYLLERI